MKRIFTFLICLFLINTFKPQTPDANGIVYVTPNGTGSGSSWNSPAGNLQGAIDATGVTKVFVAVGNYDVPSPNSFVMKNNVEIYGGFDPLNGITSLAHKRIMPNAGNSQGSVLNGKNVRTVITCTNITSALLDGFTITGGYGVGGTAGGVHISGSPLLNNLVIKDNTSIQGGGIRIQSGSPLLTNSVITGNTATSNGAGIFFPSNGTLHCINVTIANNTANSQAAFSSIAPGASITFENSIVYGSGSGTVTRKNSLIEVYTTTDNGNINATGISITDVFTNPSAGDYTLMSTSPVINKGNNDLYSGLDGNTKDLAGNPRVYNFGNGGIIDLGAYEYHNILPDNNGIIYVTENGTSNGSSWSNPTNNLQEAINAAGVTKVFVAIGSYNAETASFIMKNGVAIYGGFDPDNNIKTLSDNRILPTETVAGTVLNGQNARPVIWNVFTFGTAMNNTSILDGFTLKNGYYTSEGGAIRNVYASPTLSNLVIRNNSASNGGGIFNSYSSPVITNAVFLSNRAAILGGGIYSSNSSPVISNAVFINNSASNSGSAVYSASASLIITNSQITNNQGNFAIVGSAGNTTLNNVIIANNGTYAARAAGGTITLNNSVVFGVLDIVGSGVYNTQYSFIQGNINTANGNINTTGIEIDDVFNNALTDDYTLKYTSPVINKGNNILFPNLDANTKDLTGNPRLVGTTIDLGAYEFPYSIAPDANGIVYVKPNATGNTTGSSWDDATNDLHNAINATGVTKVFVAIGTYNVGANSFIMKNGVEIYGGFDPDNNIKTINDKRVMPNASNTNGSILNGQSTRPVIWNVFTSATAMDNTAVLDGFTVYNGSYTDGAGIRNVYASPTLRNLVIRGNGATTSGAGISNNFSSPVISNTVISGNVAVSVTTNVYGAGMYNNNNSAPVLTNTTITENKLSTTTGGMYGAGVFNAGGATPAIYNSIIWNNQKNSNPLISGADIENSSATVTLKNSITQAYTTGNTADHNLINANPLFTGTDFKLSGSSPAINAGSNSFYTGLTANTKDLAGNLRLQQRLLDLGGYESPYNAPLAPDAGNIIYVKETATGTGSGNHWDNATSDLQAAINTTGTQKVFVAIGNYDVPSPNSFVMKNDVEIYGGFDPDNNIKTLDDNRILPAETVNGSVLNGKNERNIIWNVASFSYPMENTAVLDGFTITNGLSTAANDGGGIHNDYYASPTMRNLVVKNNHSQNNGGGISNRYGSNPIFTNILVVNNTTDFYGGGIYNYSSHPVMTNVKIINNSITRTAAGGSAFGGGIYNYSSHPVMTNVKIINNSITHTAAVGTAFGGGMYNNGSNPIITNAVIAGNTVTFTQGAAYGGGMYNTSAKPTLTNVTLVNNTVSGVAVRGAGIYNTNSSELSVYNSILWGNLNGNSTDDGADIGNIGAKVIKNSITQTYNTGNTADNNKVGINPMFVSAADFSLQATSPAINSGDNSLYTDLNADTKDLAGNPRVYDFANGGIIDLGAYEYQGITPTLSVSGFTKNEIRIFPNPVKDIFFIEIQTTETAALYSLSGQFIRILNLKSGKNTVDISNLSSGGYILKTSNGNFKILKR